MNRLTIVAVELLLLVIRQPQFGVFPDLEAVLGSGKYEHANSAFVIADCMIVDPSANSCSDTLEKVVPILDWEVFPKLVS